MASSLVKIDVHLIFHVKTTSVNMHKDDLPQIFQYLGGIIKGLNGIPLDITSKKHVIS